MSRPKDLIFELIQLHAEKIKHPDERELFLERVGYEARNVIKDIERIKNFAGDISSYIIDNIYLKKCLKGKQLTNENRDAVLDPILDYMKGLLIKLPGLINILNKEDKKKAKKIPWYETYKKLILLYNLLIKYKLIINCSPEEFVLHFSCDAPDIKRRKLKMVQWRLKDNAFAIFVTFLVYLELVTDKNFFILFSDHFCNSMGEHFSKNLSNLKSNMLTHGNYKDSRLYPFLKELVEGVNPKLEVDKIFQELQKKQLSAK